MYNVYIVGERPSCYYLVLDGNGMELPIVITGETTHKKVRFLLILYSLNLGFLNEYNLSLWWDILIISWAPGTTCKCVTLAVHMHYGSLEMDPYYNTLRNPMWMNYHSVVYIETSSLCLSNCWWI